MLTTLQQAKKLKELGYGLTFTAFRYEESTGDVYNSYDPLIQCQNGDLFIKAPSIHEALEWFREVKGIESGVLPSYYQCRSNTSVFYIFHWFCVEKNKKIEVNKSTFNYSTHSLAESALLDEVMKYVERSRIFPKIETLRITKKSKLE